MTTPTSVVSLIVIGVGMGGRKHLTAEAEEAMREVDVFLIPDKGNQKDDLLTSRVALCDDVLGAGNYTYEAIPDPKRGPDRERDNEPYVDAVREWHAARTALYVEAIHRYRPDTTFGFLVWGDPALYDSTIRVVDRIGEQVSVNKTVIPGISSFQLLAAAHKVVLHDIGHPVHITTGRRLVDDWTTLRGTVVVMLDGHLQCEKLLPHAADAYIYWGANLGTTSEKLVSGRLGDVIGDIKTVRDQLRQDHGWVLDIYALLT